MTGGSAPIEYGVFYRKTGPGELDYSTPIGAIVFDGVDVTLTGSADRIEQLSNYFANPAGGWGIYLELDPEFPLGAWFDRMTYAIGVCYGSDREEYDRAIAALVDAEVKVVRAK